MLLHAEKITTNTLPDQALKFRASYYIWGALLARFAITKEFGSLKIKVPGGCAFGGARAINFHIDVIDNVFGAQYREYEDKIEFTLPASHKNDFPIYSTIIISHGATFHWMLSVATCADIKYIYNAAMEDEIPHLLRMLNAMGANIRGTGTTAIMSRGAGQLLRGGEFTIMPDRMETGAYALLALGKRDKIKLSGVDFASIRPWYNSVYEIAGKERIKWSEDKRSVEFDFSGLRDF
jgi:UDP-N-acetylglucosamine 1-carboxyvinyltransferase